LLLELTEERAALHVLHDDVKVESVVEEGVKFDDVGVVEVKLDFYLLDELIKHVFYCLLFYLLHCEQPSGFLVFCGEYLAEGT
jgi:hypothetical protein